MVDALLAYTQPRQIGALLRGQAVRVITKPGFARWDHVTPATILLAEAVDLPRGTGFPGVEILLLGSGHGALGAALGRLAGVKGLWLADTTLTALKMAERTLQVNGVAESHLLTDPLGTAALPARFDLATMELPKGRRFTRRWLFEAYAALKPGGALYLAGANTEGIQPAIKDAHSLFGNAAILGYKKGSRVARLVKPAGPTEMPGWVNEPGIRPGTWIEHDLQLLGATYHLASLPGVFSAGELDEGTHLLLDHLPPLEGSRVLDAGCGYGIIGLVAWNAGAAGVDLADNHLLSIASAEENIKRHVRRELHPGLEADRPEVPMSYREAALPVRVLAADTLDFSSADAYTHVLSNPPFHAGKEVDTLAAQAFIAQASRLLLPGGQLILVANRFLRYDRLMQSLFGNQAMLAQTGKFHVLASTKEGK
jgi:16S rRNA (guanine1207-N2)-methyltransferase